MAQTNESQEQVTINVETLQPVTRTLMTIGALPTSYLISMTYEEQLLWLQNYLIKTVIPAINNNAEATQEVQDIVMALQDYINDYFNNLDIQEEVSIKIDELIQDGTLQALLLNYTQVTKVFDTYNDMMLDTSTYVNGMKLKTLGYRYINDGGGAEYVVTNSPTVNSYTISIGVNKWIELISPKNHTKVFGGGKNGFYNCILYSDYIILDDDLTIPPQELVISANNKVIDFNGHTITMEQSNLSYANIIQVTGNNIILKNGIINGNYLYNTAENIVNHTGILCNGTNIILDNMEIYNCAYEGIILNSSTATVEINNSHIHHNGRNDIALLAWQNFKCYNSVFDGSLNNYENIANIDIEPYEDNSGMGIAEICNCTFNSSNKSFAISTYLNANTTDVAIIDIHDNIFNNSVKFGYDQSAKSMYNLINNKFTNITDKNPLVFKDTVSHIKADNVFLNCNKSILISQTYNWSSFNDISLIALFKGTNEGIELSKLEGSTSPYPFQNIYIKSSNNKIKNWHYLNNSTIDVPSLITDADIVLDFNTYYRDIYMVGYSKKCEIDGIYNKSLAVTPPITIHCNTVDNKILSTKLPTINNNIGNSGIITGANGSFSMTFHNHNYNNFIIDNIIGNYTARNS